MKTAAIRYEITKMITIGPIGLSKVIEIESILVSIRYPTKVLATAIVTLPKNPIREPIPLVIMKLPAFFSAKAKAAIAEVQKFSPVSPT